MKTYEINIFEYSVVFFQGIKPKDLIKKIKTKYDISPGPDFKKILDDCDGYTYELASQDTIMVWTRQRKDLPTLAHECVHAANMILNEKGVLPSWDNDEVQAYLVGALVGAGVSK